MQLSEWAEQHKIRYETALRWFRKGTLPFPVEKIGNTILVYPPAPPQLCPRCGWSSEDKV